MKKLWLRALSVLLVALIFVGFTPITIGAESAPAKTAEAFVERGYNYILNRHADSSGINYWTNKLYTRQIDAADMIASFVESTEFQGRKYSNEKVVEILYNVMLCRKVDSVGLKYWSEFLNSGMSDRVVINGIAKSAEFKKLCSQYGIEAGNVNIVEYRDLNPNMTRFVNNAYKQILGRKADTNSLNIKTENLNKKILYPEDILYGLIYSAECKAKTTADADFVTVLYKGFFNRTPSASDITYWTDYLKTHSRDELFNKFRVSNEYKSTLSKQGLIPRPTPTPTPSPTPLPNKMIALTFDDGPYSPVTNRILNMLEQYHGHATFFVVGDRVNSYKDTVLRAMSLGCEIGNHTYDHKSTLTSMSASMVQWEISNCNAVVKNLTGRYPSVMRPVGGAFNNTVSSNVGMPMIIWSVDTQDWKYRDANRTANAILNNVKDGDIILMHDLYPSTAAAMEMVIPELARRGYTFVTVSELAAAKGYNLQAGVPYYSLK